MSSQPPIDPNASIPAGNPPSGGNPPASNRPGSNPPGSNPPGSNPPASKPPSGPVLSMAIRDKAVLYTSYMMFLVAGGLFIPTQRPFEWGEEVTLNITLMDDPEKFNVQAKVVWMTPVGAQGNKAAGIGVQFKGDEGVRLRNRIETYLAGALNTDRPTNTL